MRAVSDDGLWFIMRHIRAFGSGMPVTSWIAASADEASDYGTREKGSSRGVAEPRRRTARTARPELCPRKQPRHSRAILIKAPTLIATSATPSGLVLGAKLGTGI